LHNSNIIRIFAAEIITLNKTIMEINVSTIYGDIRLVYCYDVSKGTFYTAYDECDNILGELWEMPYYDEEDKDESDAVFTNAVETAIDNGDISIPSNTKELERGIYTLTVCDQNSAGATAQSFVFSTMEKAKQHKQNIIVKYIEHRHTLGKQVDAVDDGEFAEVIVPNGTLRLTITIKKAILDEAIDL
jgi:hypothetical protein